MIVIRMPAKLVSRVSPANCSTNFIIITTFKSALLGLNVVHGEKVHVAGERR